MIRKKVKALWKLCFDDSEDFIEMYFRLRYNNEVNMTIESGNEVISALQMLPYPMTFCGKVIQTSYISGACTHPDYRGNGVMGGLLEKSFGRMLRDGVAISTLIPGEPWLFDYYTRMGYAAVFQYAKEEIVEFNATPNEKVVITSISEYQEAAYKYLNRKMAERPCCIQHTKADFKVILADLERSHDTLFIAVQEETVVGIAITYKQADTLLIGELFAESKEIKNYMLHRIHEKTGYRSLTILTPAVDNRPSHPLGMARIIDAKNVLHLYAAANHEVEMSIEVSDELLSANNGYYYIYNGKCMMSKERLPGTHIQLSIGELSKIVLTPLQPYMSLMLN